MTRFERSTGLDTALYKNRPFFIVFADPVCVGVQRKTIAFVTNKMVIFLACALCLVIIILYWNWTQLVCTTSF